MYLVEFYIVMNSDGEHVVDHDLESAEERFNDDYHGPYEITKVSIEMNAPKAIAKEVKATLPDDGSKEFTLKLTDGTDEA